MQSSSKGQEKVPYIPEEQVMWSIGMMMFNLQNENYHLKDKDLKDLKEFKGLYFKDLSLKEIDVMWFWLALLKASMEGDDFPAGLLPSKYESDAKFRPWSQWYKNVLCVEKDRWNLQQAWKYLEDVKLFAS